MGLVLYGGVSLAVYENGVAQELYRAVRGMGVYELLSQLIDSDIVIDIISGTSAGGVNGVMLAYAMVHNGDFTKSANLWRDDGDIQSLLRVPSDANSSSVLNSDYYQKRLECCFATSLAPSMTGADSIVPELDLFLTSTDANGAISTVFDDLGHAIDIKNHRALFKLSYRAGRKHDLDAPPSVLAKLSRMTSCFPVAFEPVLVDQSDPEDEVFLNWGNLHNSAVYLDGGILNNKPFTSTIDAIAGRTATREVERFLIYVEPNPEKFEKPPEKPASPTMVAAALSSLVSIPSYQSIAGDLQQIEAHNERAARVSEILESLPKPPTSDPSRLSTAGVVDIDAPQVSPYLAARLIQLRDAAVEAILDDENAGREYFPPETPIGGLQPNGNANNAVPEQNLRRSARILVQSFNAFAGDGLDSLKSYDIFYRMRRTKHLLDTLMRAEKTGAVVPEEVWEAVNHCFMLYEITKAALITWLTKFDFGWKCLSSQYPNLDVQPEEEKGTILANIASTIWGLVKQKMDAFLQAGTQVPSARTPKKREDFFGTLKALLSTKPAAAVAQTNLLDALDELLKQTVAELAANQDTLVRATGTMLRDEFCRFGEIDRQLFLVQVGSGFESTDVIRVVRFSPLDAQRCLSAGAVENKVRGSALSSFGGFFKKSWRANDIMMGRLDAACQLVECLLTKERLAALAFRREATPIDVTEQSVASCFKTLKPGEAAALANSINSYIDNATTATDDMWNSLVNQIVSASHNDIQAVEWPQVIAGALEQEYAWSQYRSNTKDPDRPYDSRNLVWNRAKAKPDDVLVRVAADALAKKQIPPFAPGSQTAGNFIDEIPESVLEELGAQALMRLGKGVLASVENEDARKKWATNPLYTLPFNWFAPIIYRWSRLRRTQPTIVIVLNTIVPVVCLTVILLAIMLPHLGVRSGPIQFDFLHRWGMAAGAALLLFVWGRWFRK